MSKINNILHYYFKLLIHPTIICVIMIVDLMVVFQILDMILRPYYQSDGIVMNLITLCFFSQPLLIIVVYNRIFFKKRNFDEKKVTSLIVVGMLFFVGIVYLFIGKNISMFFSLWMYTIHTAVLLFGLCVYYSVRQKLVDGKSRKTGDGSLSSDEK